MSRLGQKSSIRTQQTKLLDIENQSPTNKLTSSTSPPIHSLTNEEEEGCAIIAFEAELNDAHDDASSTSPLLLSSNPNTDGYQPAIDPMERMQRNAAQHASKTKITIIYCVVMHPSARST